MTDMTPIKTPAELALSAAFGLAAPSLPGDADVKKLRQDAFGAFESAGLPNRRIEDWKYTDLRMLMREAKPLASPLSGEDVAAARDAGAAFAAVGARRLVLVNGSFAPALSDLADLEPGLTVMPLAGVLREAHPLRERLGALAPAGNIALDLNTAFMTDGVVIHVGAGTTVARPLLIVNCHVGAATADFSRSLVVVEPDAALTLIESFEGPDGTDYQTNSALELSVGEGACVELIRHQAEGDRALHLHTLMAEVGARTVLKGCVLTTGAAVSRQQVGLALKGDHIVAALRGASLLRGRQHGDTTLQVEHKATQCESRELFRTVLDGEAHGVFQGKIIVEAEAQKTDGRMASNALVLSDRAEMSNKPELEIYADDVQCGHGATSGALDEELLFYLEARGIPAAEAEALLIQSFVGEIVDEVGLEPVREALTGQVARWLERRDNG
ncbi:Fe-S cluster assembly protein SufD [Blastochloris viridis]|uniref:FeS cluster assembly protein sufD n=1 Tax=Blastochloris viridis TaxID=1079 RepID=A0A0H5BBM2_BLAVI|nr:Fe-S cluster assembly protein SufD [Blastochloris viridis]ALK08932.1 FeS cluster assembly protein SufD [Blastochloris viridis]BAR97671.1 iron-sulfur cluster assembly protein SufD [Blastochloris viridis]CUU41593.1 FeS cluster assembly protein sufD [Blastochloris viridis]